jgi:hypothetical protein
MATMTPRHAIFAGTVLSLVCGGAPAKAGSDEYWEHGRWHAARHAIYELENGIAFFEADPEIDDGYKAPVIGGNRGAVARARTRLPGAQWRWTSPCCYSRPPIYIR